MNIRFEQEVWFGSFRYGSDLGYQNPGQILIRNGTTGLYWNGTTYQAAEVWNTTTVDASNAFHFYDWSTPAGVADGDFFHVRMRLHDDPDTESVEDITVNVKSGGGTTIVRRPVILLSDD